VDSAGVVRVLDEPDLMRRKVKRAVTDTHERVEYRPAEQPGVANLLEILAACTDVKPADAAAGISGYGQLKELVADAVIAELAPVRETTAVLLADAAQLDKIRAAGADRARERGAHRLASAVRLAGVG